MAGLALFVWLTLCFGAVNAAIAHLPQRQVNKPPSYSSVHSLDQHYSFDPRDGWEAVNISDLAYKYNTSTANRLQADKIKRNSGGIVKGAADKVSGILKTVDKVLKAIGDTNSVAITWYTGQDLKNPSCWSNGHWTPSDKSMVGAVTLEGWKSKPECLKFVQICNGPEKCIFVRIVDTCAGCAKGSRHVDLTKNAFTQLAKLEEGILTVQLRMATEPTNDDW
ncbi:hypothetical protein CONPUDRAFT_54045 [Coniophora puteana RWD-64-598 SS2]|uniref:RlpA-like protein double-psi beta-barrel domain-containing protein n=1 Tax=Coniophora puteana (strain RWD-64-598) TaxID=741705 RepID=A0A5M3MTA2_CONPW|nr:uncharacterized protein CONPUDRAFT_54045 [Coniophora puteana RWD-64-598 SS2]EIW82399.1 hypothetical protein CONPUDRAFT_54045 [Coniophora puteana RWD-64-598 SS2]